MLVDTTVLGSFPSQGLLAQELVPPTAGWVFVYQLIKTVLCRYVHRKSDLGNSLVETSFRYL